MPILSRRVDELDFTVEGTNTYMVLMLLDTSYSMTERFGTSGTRIDALNKACAKMIEVLKKAKDKFRTEEEREVNIKLTLITFGGDTADILYVNEPIEQVTWANLSCAGRTPLGDALKKAKDILESKEKNPSRAFRPMCVLVSDGEPNDEWHQPLEDFIHGKDKDRSKKAERIAMAIGDFDKSMLGLFVDGTGNAVISAGDEKDILTFFKFVANTVTNNIKNPASKTVITTLEKNVPPAPEGYINIQDTIDEDFDPFKYD